MSRTQFIVALIVVVAAIGGGFWWSARQAVIDAYGEAAAICARDPLAGSARARALDRLHGEAARPKQLRLALSTCGLREAVDRLSALR